MTRREPDWRTIHSKLAIIRRRLKTLRSLGSVEVGWWDNDDGAALIARLAMDQYGEYVRQVADWTQKRSGGR